MFNFVPQFFKVVINKTQGLTDILLHSQAPAAVETFHDFGLLLNPRILSLEVKTLYPGPCRGLFNSFI
jgi:hypothetical protein